MLLRIYQEYGYAIIVMHPEYFSKVVNETKPDILDKQKISDSIHVINHSISSSKIKIVSFSRIAGIEPVAFFDNTSSRYIVLQNALVVSNNKNNTSSETASQKPLVYHNNTYAVTIEYPASWRSKSRRSE